MLPVLLPRYFSFYGRLARFPFFARSIYAGIAFQAPLVVSLVLFSSNDTRLWWLGLFVFATGALGLAASYGSLIARRLHDLGFSGYHTVWAAAAEFAAMFASYGSIRMLLVSLPLILISLWLTFWPGEPASNRYGEP
jgi:uncharacterized membrane protein YhaH (DUF805 family)